MKHCILLVTVILLTFHSLAFAHSMPREEMYVGGVGAGCSLGYVSSIYGEPREKTEFRSDGVQVMTYVYSDTFSITGQTYAEDLCAEEDLMVVGFSLKDGSLSTPHGIAVGMPYEKAVELFGYGVWFEAGDAVGYIYPAEGSAVELTFYVDRQGIITEIYEGTEL